MYIKKIIVFISCYCLGLFAEQQVAEKDLALIFPIDESNLILTTDFSSNQSPFPKTWYDEANRAFSSTRAGNALINENYFSDWAIVAIRMVPCSTFQSHVSEENNHYCWPEIRIVWQPILYNFRIGAQRFSHYADDRAFHTLYHIKADHFLSQSHAQNANLLLEKAKANSLSLEEKQTFVRYSRQVSNAFLNDVLELRDSSFAQARFQGLGYRPETLDSTIASSFYQRLKNLLTRLATPNSLKALTAFSLPEGRQPALIGEWVFLSFKGVNGNIVPSDIVINSHTNGEPLANLGPDQHATASKDDNRLYREPVLSNIIDTVILFPQDFARLSPVIADRSQRLVSNTSCASCHKLNRNRFDFHNLSYLQDRTDITISPRVVQDVTLDQEWIEQFLSSLPPEDPDSDEPDNDTPPLESITFSNNTVAAIPDNNSTGITSTIHTNSTASYTKMIVKVGIQHSYRGDLKVNLLSPTGMKFSLHQQSGGSRDDLSLALEFELDANDRTGSWQLKVSDHARRDTGSLEGWSLTFE